MPKAPGKNYRNGISLIEFFEKFPDEESAERWWTTERWPTGVACPGCGSMNIQLGFSDEVEHRFRTKLNTGFGRS